MRKRLLLALYRLARRQAWPVLAVMLAALVPALLYLTDLKVDSTLQGLLPVNDPVLERFDRYQSALEEAEQTTIWLRLTSPPAEPGERVARLLEVGREAQQAILAHEEFTSATYQSELSGLPIFPVDLTSLSEENLQQLEDKIARLESLIQEETPLTSASRPLDEVYAEISEGLQSLLSGLAVLEPQKLAKTLQQLGEDLEKLRNLNREVRDGLIELPRQLGRAEEEIDRLSAQIASFQSALRQPTPQGEQYLLSRDKTSLLVHVKPGHSSTKSIEYNRRVTQLIREELQSLDLQARGIEWGLKGPYSFSVQSDRVLREDMSRTAAITIIGVFLLFVIVLRRFFYPLLATVPVLIALVLTLVWAKYAYGGLNLLTAFLPAIALGLGIDYGIQFFSHYLEERGGSRRITPALRRTLLTKGSAMTVAALATSTVLFGLGAVARSPGLAEMGTILGLAVLLSCLLTLVLLPAMIVAAHRAVGRRGRGHPPRPWDLSALARFPVRGRWVVIGAVLAGTAAIAWPASQIEFRFLSESLMPRGLPSQQVSAHIQENFELAGQVADPENYFLFFVEPSEEVVREVSNELYRLQAVDQRPWSYYSTLGPFSEPEKRAWLERQLATLRTLDPTRPLQALRERLEATAQFLGRKDEILRELEQLAEQLDAGQQQILTSTGDEALADEFASLLASTRAIQDRLEEMEAAKIEDRLFVLREKASGLIEATATLLRQIPAPEEIDRLIENPPPEIRKNFFTSEGRVIVFAHVQQEWLWDSALYDRFIDKASQISDQYLGHPMIRARVEYYAKRDFAWSTALAALIILIILRLDFARSRARGGTWLSALTLGLGYLWLLGVLHLRGIDFNVANILISPLLIGLGVDNCVYLIHRHRDLSGSSVERATASTALPIIANTLATMIGFGSLLLAETPVLRLLGESAVLGIGLMTLFSLIFLPAALAVRR